MSRNDQAAAAARCTGMHGQTFICSDIEKTRRFYVNVLGLRLVKRTVHPHDPRLPLYYFSFPAAGGARTTPPEIVGYVEWNPIFFEFPALGLTEPAESAAALQHPRAGDVKGRWGVGTNHHLSFHVRDRRNLLQWKRYLTDAGIHVTGPYDRNYFQAIYFQDPDDAILEITSPEPGFDHDEASLGSEHKKPPAGTVVGQRAEIDVAAETWPEPVTRITPDMALFGFHHLTSVCRDSERTTAFFVEQVGVRLIKRTDYMDDEGTQHYYAAGPDVRPGAVFTYFGFPKHERGRLGVGLAHHFTLRVPDLDALNNWRERLISKAVKPSAIQDHTYFSSCYFRDPDGHIVSIATPADFAVDETAAALGTRLCLPPQWESRRLEIERNHRLRPAPSPAAASSATANA